MNSDYRSLRLRIENMRAPFGSTLVRRGDRRVRRGRRLPTEISAVRAALLADTAVRRDAPVARQRLFRSLARGGSRALTGPTADALARLVDEPLDLRPFASELLAAMRASGRLTLDRDLARELYLHALRRLATCSRCEDHPLSASARRRLLTEREQINLNARVALHLHGERPRAPTAPRLAKQRRRKRRR